MDTDLGFILEKLGLTKAESGVFNTLVHLKSSSIGQVIRQSGLHRGTVYNPLQRLIQKGLVYTSEADGTKIYGPNQQGFLSDLADERQKIMEKSKLIKELSNRVKLSRTLESDSGYGAKTLQGRTAFKSLKLDLYHQSQRNGESYRSLGKGCNKSKTFNIQYHNFTQQIKASLGVKCNMILSESIIRHPEARTIWGNIKWAPANYNFGDIGFWIYGRKVVLVHWRTNPLRMEVLEDKNYFNWYGSIHNAFWKDVALKHAEYIESNVWR